MLAEVGTGRMFFPPEDKNKPEERDVLHPETDTRAVLMPDGSSLEGVVGNIPVFSYSEAETRLKYAGKRDAFVFELKK